MAMIIGKQHNTYSDTYLTHGRVCSDSVMWYTTLETVQTVLALMPDTRCDRDCDKVSICIAAQEQGKPTIDDPRRHDRCVDLQTDFGPFPHGVLLLKNPKSREDDSCADTSADAMVQLVELRAQMKP